jgi:hypothetical protein
MPYENGNKQWIMLVKAILRPLMLRKTKDVKDKEERCACNPIKPFNFLSTNVFILRRESSLSYEFIPKFLLYTGQLCFSHYLIFEFPNVNNHKLNMIS